MKKIILDTDSVGDDILAIFYAVLHENIEVLGVTTVTGAAGDIQQASWTAQNTVDLAKSKVPVFAGMNKPLKRVESQFDGDPVNFEKKYAEKFGERLKMFNTPARRPQTPVSSENAVDFIIRTIHENPNEVSIVITGPITNVGAAFEKDPSIVDLIEHVYVMGGCFNYPGNITPVVEFNIWGDPEAAKIVFNSGVKTTIVPLDICENNKHADGMLTRDDLYDIISQSGSNNNVSQYINEKFPIYIDLWREAFGLVGFPMDDVIAVALSIDESFCKYTEYSVVDVELEGKLARGQTIHYDWHQILDTKLNKPETVRIAYDIDGRKFMEDFRNTIINSKL